MDYTVDYLPDKRYVVARLMGPIISEATWESASRVFEMASRHHCRRILIDTNQVTSEVPMSDVYEFISRLEEAGYDRRMSLAVVATGSPVAYHFIETVAMNRGFHFRVFSELSEAESWLAGHAVAST